MAKSGTRRALWTSGSKKHFGWTSRETQTKTNEEGSGADPKPFVRESRDCVCIQHEVNVEIET